MFLLYARVLPHIKEHNYKKTFIAKIREKTYDQPFSSICKENRIKNAK